MSAVAREGSSRRGTAVALTILFSALAAFAIAPRLPMLREGLWRDEAISVSIAAAPTVPGLLARNRVSDYNPPLFNLLLAAETRLFGSGEVSLKLLALSLGLLAAAGTTALAFELGGPFAAALTAALAVNNPLLIEMSTELRAYSLSLFLATIAFLVIFRLRRRGSGPGSLLGVWALLTLLVYSHVAGGILTAVIFGWALFEWRRGPSRPFGGRLALAALAAGATYVFWLPTTWRQFRAGIPWETPLTSREKVESLLHRTTDVLPIPQALEQPLVLLGIAALLVVGVLCSSAVAAGFRGRWTEVVVPTLAGIAVWVPLGLFSRHTRYLVIPAGLAAVVLSTVVARVGEAARTRSATLRRAALAAVGLLIAASLWARRDLYEARSASAGRPKSGIRTLCRSPSLAPSDAVIVLPDYLAPTVWYYCGRREDVRGFARWSRPDLFDPSGHGESWRDPEATAKSLSALDREVAARRPPRILLIRELAPAGYLPFYRQRAAEFEAALARRFDERLVGRFPGRVESVEMYALTPR